MTNAEFKEVLEDRTAKYAVGVFKYLRELPYDVSTKVVAHQLGKSASSIGANYHEANRSESRDDFAHKVAIAVKEKVFSKVPAPDKLPHSSTPSLTHSITPSLHHSPTPSLSTYYASELHRRAIDSC